MGRDQGAGVGGAVPFADGHGAGNGNARQNARGCAGMFERENAIGLLLLGLCLATAGVLVYGIATGTRLRFTGPTWVGVLLAVVFVGGALYGTFGRGRRWPDPLVGRARRRWPWSRRGDDG